MGSPDQEVRDELAAGGFLSDVEVEGLASCQHVMARARTPEALAEASGLRVVRTRDLPPAVLAILAGRVILVQARAAEEVQRLGILHETSHAILGGVPHTHGDVWRLTLALARTREMAAVGFRLAADNDSDQIPAWALALRDDQLREVGG